MFLIILYHFCLSISQLKHLIELLQSQKDSKYYDLGTRLAYQPLTVGELAPRRLSDQVASSKLSRLIKSGLMMFGYNAKTWKF